MGVSTTVPGLASHPRVFLQYSAAESEGLLSVGSHFPFEEKLVQPLFREWPSL
jgi:hypothetical protein